MSVACLSHATGGWFRSLCLFCNDTIQGCEDAADEIRLSMSGRVLSLQKRHSDLNQTKQWWCEDAADEMRLSMSGFKWDVSFWETSDTKSTIMYILITTSQTVGKTNVL